MIVQTCNKLENVTLAFVWALRCSEDNFVLTKLPIFFSLYPHNSIQSSLVDNKSVFAKKFNKAEVDCHYGAPCPQSIRGRGLVIPPYGNSYLFHTTQSIKTSSLHPFLVFQHCVFIFYNINNVSCTSD